MMGKGKLEDDLDVLFKLPLAEFTAARNSLAAELKRAGRGNESDFVKSLTKPSISAWAVNQLYWDHREAFDELIAASERISDAQSSARKGGDIRGALDARREALAELSDLAANVLRDAGHNPSQDTIRRITTTLEAMSAYSSAPDAPRPGRLTHDVDPPGFESLASMMSGMIASRGAGTSSSKSTSAATSTPRKPDAAVEARKVEATRQKNIAEAKGSLQEAKSLLAEARTRVQSLETAQKKASAEAKDADKQKREAEERFAKAKAAAEDAARRARVVALETEEATKAMHDARRAVEKATKELELLFRESPRR